MVSGEICSMDSLDNDFLRLSGLRICFQGGILRIQVFSWTYSLCDLYIVSLNKILICYINVINLS